MEYPAQLAHTRIHTTKRKWYRKTNEYHWFGTMAFVWTNLYIKINYITIFFILYIFGWFLTVNELAIRNVVYVPMVDIGLARCLLLTTCMYFLVKTRLYLSSYLFDIYLYRIRRYLHFQFIYHVFNIVRLFLFHFLSIIQKPLDNTNKYCVRGNFDVAKQIMVI